MSEFEEVTRQALLGWGFCNAMVAPLGTGLVNRTFLVEHANKNFVLQQVNAIFDPRIHENIHAVTNLLARAGLTTLELVPTLDGRLWSESAGVWRMYRHIDGVSFDTATSGAQVRSAGRLVGTFHAVLEPAALEFVGARLGVHHTERHLASLQRALVAHEGHRLMNDVRPLAEELVLAAGRLPSLPELALRPGHGDLKLSNVLFERTEPSRALCLVDLDTVGPIHLAHELGDMWRSWCNRATEDDAEAKLDLDIMRESWLGYCEGLGRSLTADERESALLGIEWISLELSVRFAADALNEAYFGWNSVKFASLGDHNLRRARGQWSLHRAVCRTRQERRSLLDSTG